MTRATDVTSINCTSCGAGLDVLGGGRVQTHVCGYCGSQLDAQDDYKVLQKFANLDRPESPFRIGMTGKVRGIEYTVIGTLGHEERYAGRVWKWVDHQLFSPTHGYAFMTVEKGHFIFSRAYRKAITPRWIDERQLDHMETPPSITSDSQRYRYYDSSHSSITFAEGEFNWQPKIGDSAFVMSFMSNDAVLALSKTATEEEIIRSTYPDQLEIATSFGLEYAPRLEGVHRLQPYQSGAHSAFVQKTLGIAAIVCFVLYLGLLLLGGGREAETVTGVGVPVSVPFTVSAPNRIAKIVLDTSIDNTWVYYEVDVADPDGESVFETGREISFYSGRDSDGRWSEGSRGSTLRFMPRVAGPHTLNITLGEAESPNANGNLSVRISEGGMVARWFLFAAFLFLVVWFLSAIGRGRHYKARWRGWDWNS